MIPEDLKGFAICTSPRTGSNYLCELISSTNVLGNPDEYFNWPEGRLVDDPAHDDSVEGRLRIALSNGQTQNGIYGLKLFAHQHDIISSKIHWRSYLPNLSFVFLTRRDLIGQAISWALAVQTGKFRSNQDAFGEPDYDSDLIEELLLEIVKENARWQLYFAAAGIQPLSFVYEDVISDPKQSLAKLGALMGLNESPLPTLSSVVISKQRSKLNCSWKERFIADHQDREKLHRLCDCYA
ncbi:hypothetical protein HB779_08335 [Phyllobacterium sp. 628]|uniref:Stf0 family sulfotransferase n=1 Tax=Phyllobacterium sp. 628 TaxID=2718938 RepID=UPI0016625B88|nr:Stf0 family sulfotransferase [Phyllobacterium sp. 628]QND51910.1 hypothetical protein HB779_08335 [Phyllobacterium sp. 628]